MSEIVTRWSTDDFDQLSWHDCHVHGLKIVEGVHGPGDLELDLDYLVEWKCGIDRSFQFLIAPATLTFQEMSNLHVELDYRTLSAAMGPFSLQGIEREAFSYPSGFLSFHWKLPINWPGGSIALDGPGFTQTLRSPPRLVDRQYLLPAERV